ncbi:MAG: hypothetical protein RLZZ466_576 [Bacteroidota bacterium]|jgi:hypothetical protein
MASIDDFSEFTIERYQALYDRIRSKQAKLVSEFAILSRDNEKGLEVAKAILILNSSIAVEHKLSRALDIFDSCFPLWFTMPQLMESVEPIRLEMLEKYERSKTVSHTKTHSKTVNRFKLFGFIPTLAKVVEVYNTVGELQYVVHFEWNFSVSKWKELRNAKNKHDADQILSTIYRQSKIVDKRPNTVESQFLIRLYREPTRKNLFHAIVKYRAMNDFTQQLLNLDFDSFSKNFNIYQDPKILRQPILSEIPQTTEFDQYHQTRSMETSRKRQAIAYYYLLNAGGVKGILSNKSEFARFMAFMSGSDSVDGNKTAANIYNTSYYRNIKLLFGSKTTQFNPADLDAVIKQFEEMDQGQNSVLSQAIEQLIKDKESLE